MFAISLRPKLLLYPNCDKTRPLASQLSNENDSTIIYYVIMPELPKILHHNSLSNLFYHLYHIFVTATTVLQNLVGDK